MSYPAPLNNGVLGPPSTIVTLVAPMTSPPTNVYEGNGQLSIAMPIPGAHPEHVEVLVRPSTIDVRAECKYPQEVQHFLRHDWQVGSVATQISLPRTVDPMSARATLNFGVLVVMARLSDSGVGESRPQVE